MRNCNAFVCFAAMFLCIPCFAQKHHGSQPCGNYNTQSEVNMCAQDVAAAADSKLNKVSAELLAKLKDDAFLPSKIVAAETAWIAYRDADLALSWPLHPKEDPLLTYGSAHPLCYYRALADMTNQRILEIQNWMTHTEGDICSRQLAKCGALRPNASPGD
jgi:uncharacterized protein YecT (DUF1311 family)